MYFDFFFFLRRKRIKSLNILCFCVMYSSRKYSKIQDTIRYPPCLQRKIESFNLRHSFKFKWCIFSMYVLRPNKYLPNFFSTALSRLRLKWPFTLVERCKSYVIRTCERVDFENIINFKSSIVNKSYII